MPDRFATVLVPSRLTIWPQPASGVTITANSITRNQSWTPTLLPSSPTSTRPLRPNPARRPPLLRSNPRRAMSRARFFGAAGAVGASLACASVPAAPAAAAQDPTSAETPSGPAAAPANWVSEAGGPVAIPSTIAMGSGARPGRHRDRISRNPPGRLLARVADPEPRFLVGAHTPRGGRRPGRHAAEPPLPAADRQARGTRYSGSRGAQLRRLYLRNDENDLYSLGYVQDIEAIEYDAWYPMTTLRYRDATLPLRVQRRRLLALHAGQGPRVGHARLPFRLHAGEYFP